MRNSTALSNNINTKPARKVVRALGGLAVLATLGWSSIALADGWPSSVTGTWSARANLSTGNLVISSQGATGNCRTISGTIIGDALEGFYCPFSGRIGFARKNSAGTPIQYYEGNVSQDGTIDHIGGTFAVWTAGQGQGVYSFSATR